MRRSAAKELRWCVTAYPCEAFAHHGFNGIEDKVVADMAAFIAQPARK